MAFPGILRRLFENEGAGPLLLPSLFRQTNYTTTLTTSGNWTAPHSGYYLVEAQGGGGGAGSAYAAGSNVLAAGGAPSGGYVTMVKWYAKGTVIAYSIGAHGLGDAPDSSGNGVVINATSGGNTTFDGLTALGGSPSSSLSYLSPNNIVYCGFGVSAPIGGQDGANAATGFWNKNNNLFGNIYSGSGGNSPFGQGGARVGINATVQAGVQGDDATGYGAGGAGAVAGNGANYRGGNGSQGCVRVTFIGV